MGTLSKAMEEVRECAVGILEQGWVEPGWGIGVCWGSSKKGRGESRRQ